jgi:hypothetical protein
MHVDTLWAGSYKGGLYQWHITTGYQAIYTTTHGLAGEDIVVIIHFFIKRSHLIGWLLFFYNLSSEF